jgi:hypothetical protein
MELEPAGSEFAAKQDRRPHIPEPLPVRLIALADVTLLCSAMHETQLDDFYASMLLFVKELGHGIVYRADNFRLRFEIINGLIQRESYRRIMIEVQSLADTREKLDAREIEYTYEKTLTLGHESLWLTDPAGNNVEIVEFRAIG